MTSSQHAPYALGCTHATMGGTEGSKTARWSRSHKAVLSSDRSLQLDSVKSESLVIAAHHTAMNTSLLLAHTVRQSNQVGLR